MLSFRNCKYGRWLFVALLMVIDNSGNAAQQKVDVVAALHSASSPIRKQQVQNFSARSRRRAIAEVAVINAALQRKTQPHHLKQAVAISRWQAALHQSSRQSIWPRLTKHFALAHYAAQPQVHEKIVWYMRHREVFYTMLHNARPYLYYVLQQTRLRRLPAEFALLPMVESGYNPAAYSSAGATGLWQMVPATAASFGLHINWWYDGRRDIVVSTQAALNYIAQLYLALHNWLLVAAAYDFGVGAVQAAQAINLRQQRSIDFWSLSLPQETRHYVPKLLALAAIIKNPHRYGFRLPYIADRPYFRIVALNSQIDLQTASHFSGISIAVLKKLNPGMLRWATNPHGIYSFLVPVAVADKFTKQLLQKTGDEHISWQYHEVRVNETLASIGKIYHVRPSYLQKINGLQTRRVAVGAGLLVPVNLHHTYSNPLLDVLVQNIIANSLSVKSTNTNTSLSEVVRRVAKVDVQPKTHAAVPVAKAKNNRILRQQRLPSQDKQLKTVLSKITAVR